MSAGRPPLDAGLDRLRAILDAYGGDPLHWPEVERDDALALIACSGDARRLHDTALRLDAALDALPAAAPSPGLEDRIVAAALTGGTRAARTASVHPIATARSARRPGRGWRSRILAGAVPLAAAAALAVWLHAERAPQPGRGSDVAVAEIALADLGVYETPGDELLEVSVLDDVYDADPWNGCADGDLGCLQVETLPLEPLSRDDEPAQEVRFLS